MQIICRHARDDYSALMTAQGMEDAGADVFSITLNTETNSATRFVVFAKYDPDVMCATSPDQIDEAIMRRLYPED